MKKLAKNGTNLRKLGTCYNLYNDGYISAQNVELHPQVRSAFEGMKYGLKLDLQYL